MDVDPLADTAPPRHAVESDDEEDDHDPIDIKATVESGHIADVQLTGDLPQSHSLIIAAGDIAKFWARGANLGEQCGVIAVDGIQVGFAFRPAWTKAVVIISEVLTRLPLWAMFRYAFTILDTLKPSSVALLDAYPVVTYMTAAPTPFQDAPTRYLSTSSLDLSLRSKVSALSPPNLLPSTSASFLSILGTTMASPGTVLLVPSPYVPHPSPKLLLPSTLSHLSEDRFECSPDMMNTTHELLFAVVNESTPPKWENLRGKDILTTRRRSAVEESSMYI